MRDITTCQFIYASGLPPPLDPAVVAEMNALLLSQRVAASASARPAAPTVRPMQPVAGRAMFAQRQRGVRQPHKAAAGVRVSAEEQTGGAWGWVGQAGLICFGLSAVGASRKLQSMSVCFQLVILMVCL